MKKTSLLIGVILTLAFLIPSAVFAYNVKTSDSIYIADDEVVEGNMYVMANNVTIEGVVNGDLLALSQNINVKGAITGDIITISQNLNVEGEIGGNIRSIANTVSIINSTIDRNINLIAANILIGENSTINWDALVLSGLTEHRGKINGSLHGAGDKIIISGLINKDLNFTLNTKENRYQNKVLEISENANINGNLKYSFKDRININKDAIGGTITYNETKIKKSWQKNVWSFLMSIFSALVIMLVFISLSKKEISKIQNKIRTRHVKSLVLGLGILFLTPIVSLILMFTIIGIPLALIVLILWLIMLYISQILVGVALGKEVRKKLFKSKQANLMADSVIGVSILWSLFLIPFLGPVLMFFAVILGLGATWRYKKEKLKK